VSTGSVSECLGIDAHLARAGLPSHAPPCNLNRVQSDMTDCFPVPAEDAILEISGNPPAPPAKSVNFSFEWPPLYFPLLPASIGSARYREPQYGTGFALLLAAAAHALRLQIWPFLASLSILYAPLPFLIWVRCTLWLFFSALSVSYLAPRVGSKSALLMSLRTTLHGKPLLCLILLGLMLVKGDYADFPNSSPQEHRSFPRLCVLPRRGYPILTNSVSSDHPLATVHCSLLFQPDIS